MQIFPTSWQLRKPQDSRTKISLSNPYSSSPQYKTKTFHSTNLFFSLQCPISTHKQTHTTHNPSIPSDEGLTLKRQCCNSLQWPIYINSVDNTKLHCRYTFTALFLQFLSIIQKCGHNKWTVSCANLGDKKPLHKYYTSLEPLLCIRHICMKWIK